MALNSVLSWFVKKRIHQIDLFKKYPHEVQEEVLFRLIKQAQHTEWGKEHGYSDIQSVDEYRQRFPIQRYKDILPFRKIIIIKDIFSLADVIHGAAYKGVCLPWVCRHDAGA